MQHLTTLILGLSILGIVTSLWAYRGFTLRVWKETMYFFVGGLVVFTGSQVVVLTDIPSSILLKNTMELLAMLGFTYGILKIKKAAMMTGA
ncbi:MAG: hypothetical protein MUP66_01405 [Candidatus Nanohaloarchaeota archaeon QJJ-5]|nr:hypothetical protein [Candidatus Nanohaloarchaeota archaeon QJJ-5]